MNIVAQQPGADELGAPPDLWTRSCSRRDALKAVAGAAVASTIGIRLVAQEKSTGLQFSLSRFLMKGDFPRLEVTTRYYRLTWHGRYFDLRLASTARHAYDERVSYTDFGRFAVGGLDLLCGHLPRITLSSQEQAPIGFGRGNLSACVEDGVFLLEHADEQQRTLRLWLACAPDSPHLKLGVLPEGFDAKGPLLLSIPGNLIFDHSSQADTSASYSSSGAGTGLRIAGPESGCVTVLEAPQRRTLVCRLPVNRYSEWVWTVLGPGQTPKDGAAGTPRPGNLGLQAAKCRPVPLADLDVWERQELKRHHWETPHGRVRERVAGVFVTAHKWHHPVSWLPEATVEAVETRILPKLIDSRSFQAIGFSRDGITERGENSAWFRLVAKTHQAGLRVYMKPGDGELTYLKDKEAVTAWAKSCFDVPPEQQCDVVRLPWEAVVVPWVTANLCLPPRFYTPELLTLAGLPWETARDRIVNSVTDRVSFVIDSIRRHAPRITIDLECSDTAVVERLRQRHENLGVMYMCYGFYPRIKDYLDLYYAVARFQMGAQRVVLETDCYYTETTASSLAQLSSRQFEQLYPQHELDLMAAKHRYMNNLPAEAAWAWGVNVTYTEKKLKAVCEAAD